MSMKDMIANFLKEVESTKACVKKMRNGLSAMSQLVHFYSTSIKNLEQQMINCRMLLIKEKVERYRVIQYRI